MRSWHTFFRTGSGRRRLLLGVLGVAMLCVVAASWGYVRQTVLLLPCTFGEQSGARVECAFGVMKDELMTHGAPASMDVFTRALALIPEFRGNCHHLAHRIGDMAYYDLYGRALRSLPAGHPYTMSACNFGFFHGYYEHLFQDHPTPEAVLEECAPLPQGPAFHERMIRQICVHGGGHGFVLAEVDRGETFEGSVYAAAQAPLAACAALDTLAKDVLSKDELYRCPGGVFTELTQFQYLEEYGFSFSSTSSEWFTDCSRFAYAHAEICVKATAQLLYETFGPQRTFEGCAFVRGELRSACVWGVVWGFFSQKTTEAQFEKAFDFCNTPGIAAADARNDCFDALSGEIYSYYPQQQKERFCRMFPEELQKGCFRRINPHD